MRGVIRSMKRAAWLVLSVGVAEKNYLQELAYFSAQTQAVGKDKGIAVIHKETLISSETHGIRDIPPKTYNMTWNNEDVFSLITLIGRHNA